MSAQKKSNKTAGDRVENSKEALVGGYNSFVKKFFRLSPEEREKAYNQVSKSSNAEFPYFFTLITSSLIISLGLIINSSSVVIGGMLISPVLWPILAFSMSVTRGKKTRVKKSVSLLIQSILIIFSISLLVGFISPFNTFKDEVLTRTQPTLVELIIGFTAGLVAAYAVSSKKIVSSIAGVAVAVALVPPLCVAGLTFSANLYASAIGAFLLFSANLLAIVVSSMMVFIAEGYFTSTTTNYENIRKKYLTWSFLSLIIISIPLLVLTKSLIQEQTMLNFTAQTTKSIYPSATISELSINNGDFYIDVVMTIQSEESVSQEALETLSRVLSARFEKPVTINISTIKISKQSSTNYLPVR